MNLNAELAVWALQWLALPLVLAALGLFAWGSWRR